MPKKTVDPLESWATLNAVLQDLTEEQCNKLLDREKAKGDAARLQFLLRLYGRINRLRTKRERKELARGGK